MGSKTTKYEMNRCLLVVLEVSQHGFITKSLFQAANHSSLTPQSPEDIFSGLC